MITEEIFISSTKYPPEGDDMERVNCPLAGQPGHLNCGWNYTKNLPAYSVPTSAEDRIPRDIQE